MMKKMLLASALLCAALGAVSAQEGAVLLDVGSYSKLFLHAGGKLAGKYYDAISDADYENISAFGGRDLEDIDTPLEIALLSTCAGVIDIRPAEADRILPANNPRLSDLKLGAAAYMDMQAAKFLGSDPAPYAAALQFITGRGRVTEADIRDFVKQGIASEVDKHFNAKHGNFVPGAVYGELKKAGEPDALALIRNAVTGFFTDPNKNTYAVLTGIEARYWLNGSLERLTLNFSAANAFYGLLNALSPALAQRVSNDVSQSATALARVPNDSQYDIFSNPPGIGGGNSGSK